MPPSSSSACVSPPSPSSLPLLPLFPPDEVGQPHERARAHSAATVSSAASSTLQGAPAHDQPADALSLLVRAGGVGKTTLGLIAATSLRRSFIDADSAFQTLHGPISQFVNTHGWHAFRDAETRILAQLLREHPRGYVVACGGGVVERDENRDMLARFRDEQGCPIVHVVRDKEETVRYLVDEQARCVLPLSHSLPLHLPS